MAVQELEDALDAFFKGRYHSAIVLAAASEQLFGGYLLKYGLTSAYPHERSIITRIANVLRAENDEKETSEKAIGDLMNRVYNHSKHAGKTELKIEMDAKDEAARVIDRAISNYDQLFTLVEHDLPDLPQVQRFRTETILNLHTE
jgi:hypothetical protein